MGRKLLEIRNFNKGMAGYVDGEDPDPEVGALALNIDPDSPLGILRGIEGTASVLTHTGAATQFDRMRLLEKRTGENVIVGIEDSTGEVALIEDYDNTPVYNDLGQVNIGQQTTIAIQNNQAYIGTGSGSNTIPQWIGEIENEQFGTSAVGGYQVREAQTKRPTVHSFDSSQEIKSAGGVMTTQILTTSGDPTECPEKGYLVLKVKTNNPDLGTTSEAYTEVTYTSRDANGFYGLDWKTNAENLIVNGFSIGDISNDKVCYSEGFVSETISTLNGENSTVHWGQGDDNTDNFEEGEYWALAMSYVYDGYKESPLRILERGSQILAFEKPDSFEPSYLFTNINIQGFYGSNTLDERVTAIHLWIAPFSSEGRFSDFSENQNGSFRRISTLDITVVPTGTYDLALSLGGDTIGYRYNDAGNNEGFLYSGPTYEDVSGQPEVIETTSLHYGMGVSLNSELFVADIYNPSAPDENWTNYICRSEPLRFENFDWINNYVILPRPVVAIAEFAGRIYAFDRFTMYRINPQRLYIEDTYEGVGALNADSVITTEYGLFIASYHDVYHFDGKSINRISQAIANMEAVNGYDKYGYRNFVQNELSDQSGSSLRLSFDSELRCLLIYGNSTTDNVLWLYRIDRGTWFVADGQEFPSVCLSNRNSILASGVSDKTIYELFRGTRTGWTWISKKLSMGQTSQKKKFRKVEANGDSVTISYRIDSPVGTFSSINNLDSFQQSSNGEWMQVRIDGTGSQQCNSLGVLFRDKGGYPS